MSTSDAALMDAGAVETPELIETPEVETGAEVVEGQEPSVEQTDGAQPTTSFEKDGSPNQAALKSAFGKLAEGDKKLADHIRGRYFEGSEIKKLFPGGLAEVRGLKETFETFGGEEGLNTLRQEAQDYATELTMVANGDPKVLDNIIADSKDGFLKLAAESIPRLKSLNPELYGQISMAGFSDVLRSSGFPDGINTMAGGIAELVSDIQEGRQQQALDAARNLGAWFVKFKAMSVPPKSNEPDERVKALDTREQTLKTKEENDYRAGFNSRLNSNLVIPGFKKQMTDFFKGKTLTNEQKQRIEKNFYTDLSEEFKEKGFRSKLDILLQRKDEKGMLNLYRSRLDELIPKVFKNVTSGLGWRGNGAPRTNGTGGGVIVLSKKPDAGDIDWTKDKSRARFMKGEATLKTGKEARWDWNKV